MKRSERAVMGLHSITRAKTASDRNRAARSRLRASTVVVKVRDGGMCFVCGRRGTQVHHRNPRKMGGSNKPWINQPANLLLLCTECHRKVESDRTWAMGRGLLVPQARRPDTWPVYRESTQQWYRLDDDGKATPVTVTAAHDLMERTTE